MPQDTYSLNVQIQDETANLHGSMQNLRSEDKKGDFIANFGDGRTEDSHGTSSLPVAKLPLVLNPSESLNERVSVTGKKQTEPS